MWSLDNVEVPIGGDKDKNKKTAFEEETLDEDLDALSERSGSIAAFAKKMSLSMSGDCLSSLREAIAVTNRNSTAVTADQPSSSDTEEGDDLETEDEVDNSIMNKPVAAAEQQQKEDLEDEESRSLETPTTSSAAAAAGAAATTAGTDSTTTPTATNNEDARSVASSSTTPGN